ncbi:MULTISPECIES: BMC domain-containing protein [Bacillus]|uniref:BMC domain-containing protein n=1 Tax=Bacillus TaxID=1386 RepID=UPI0002F1975D|nr:MULTISPECIES: BMC domain-containing protein [Bacillus]
MGKALGMIETRGLIGSIVAADAMLKAADVHLIKQEKIDAALVSIIVQGDVSAVQAAVDVGKESAARVGELISYHVIPNPDDEVGKTILHSHRNKVKTSASKSRARKPKVKNEAPPSEGEENGV